MTCTYTYPIKFIQTKLIFLGIHDQTHLMANKSIYHITLPQHLIFIIGLPMSSLRQDPWLRDVLQLAQL